MNHRYLFRRSLLSLVQCAVLLPLLAAAQSPLPADVGAAPGNGAIGERHECLIEPRTRAAIGSPVQGIVERLLVDRGETVTAGQAVAELVSDVDEASVEVARARAAATSEITAREADLALARLDLVRSEDLHRQGLLQAQKRDEAEARQQIAGAAVVQALENLKLLKLEQMRAERQLALRTLRAPFDGVVVERHVFPGEFVYDNPVLTIAEVDPLRVEVVLPARLVGSIAVGDAARVVAELDGERSLRAEVDVVDGVLDAASGTFGVRLTLPNPERAIVGGQKCRIDFTTRSALANGDADR